MRDDTSLRIAVASALIAQEWLHNVEREGMGGEQLEQATSVLGSVRNLAVLYAEQAIEDDGLTDMGEILASAHFRLECEIPLRMSDSTPEIHGMVSRIAGQFFDRLGGVLA